MRTFVTLLCTYMLFGCLSTPPNATQIADNQYRIAITGAPNESKASLRDKVANTAAQVCGANSYVFSRVGLGENITFVGKPNRRTDESWQEDSAYILEAIATVTCSIS